MAMAVTALWWHSRGLAAAGQHKGVASLAARRQHGIIGSSTAVGWLLGWLVVWLDGLCKLGWLVSWLVGWCHKEVFVYGCLISMVLLLIYTFI
jgi:hypothetical protein